MSLFFVDNSCDLEFEQIRKLGIECFSLPYLINDVEHSFDDDFSYEKFFSKVRKGIVLSHRQLTKEEYVQVFEPALNGGDDVVYVHASGEMFDYTNLEKAKEKLLTKYPDRKFEMIDSKNFSAGLSMLSLELAIKYKNGCTIDEILDYSYQAKDKIATYMVVKSLENMTLNGVVESNNLVGSSLNVNYIVSIDYDGNFKVVDKVSGRKKAVSKLIQIVRQTGENLTDYSLIVTESQISNESAEMVAKLREYFGEDLKVIMQKMSPTTTSIVGLGAIAIAFKVHRKLN